MQFFVDEVVQAQWTRINQVDEAIKWLDSQLRDQGKEYEMNLKAFKEASGSGVVVTEEEIIAGIDVLFEKNKDEIAEKKHDFNFVKL